jgi:GNAT superfamily N-acetyltransferase
VAASEFEIREAQSADAEGIASLLGELGYASETADVTERILRAATSHRDVVLVALNGTTPIAVASVHLVPLFHRSSHVARVTAFVVSKGARRLGVGSSLLKACEQFAVLRGAERVEVTSGDARTNAHAFYEARGLRREGVRFSKTVGRSY